MALIVAQFWLLPLLAGLLATHAPRPEFSHRRLRAPRL